MTTFKSDLVLYRESAKQVAVSAAAEFAGRVAAMWPGATRVKVYDDGESFIDEVYNDTGEILYDGSGPVRDTDELADLEGNLLALLVEVDPEKWSGVFTFDLATRERTRRHS